MYYLFNKSLYVVAKLGVADVIKDNSVHYKVIASEVNALPEKLFRVIRYLTSEGYFVLSRDGFVSLTANGQFLRSDRDDSMRWCSIHWYSFIYYSNFITLFYCMVKLSCNS